MRSLWAAVGPTARASHLGPASVTVLLGAVPTGVVLARGDPSVATPMVVAVLAAGAAIGWASEDPCAEVLGPLPVATAARSALRALSVLGVASVIGSVVLIAAAIGPGLPTDVGQRVVEGVAAAGASLALGLALNRRGDPGAGAAGVAAGLLVPGLVAALSTRWPGLLPTFADSAVHGRWWLIVAGLALAVAWVGRDPGRR